MLNPPVYRSHSSRTLFQVHQPFVHGNGSASLPLWSSSSLPKRRKNIQTGFFTTNIKAVASPATENYVIVKAVVTVKPTVRGFSSNLGIERGLDDIKDLLGKTLLLELVSAELDPRTLLELEGPIDERNEVTDEEFWKNFLRKPEGALLQCFPSQIQATRVMAVLDILSSHSPDEEYLGESLEPAWAEDPIIKSAFERFKGTLLELEGTIDERNANVNLKNRNGAGVVPYELLKPFSTPGVTGKGVPCSISI